LKQQAARFPDLSFESVFSIRIARVSRFLVAPIQRIQSQRATGVMSIHNLLDRRAAFDRCEILRGKK